MKECIGRYFVKNGMLKNCRDFDPCFLDDPFYIYEVFRIVDSVPLFFEDHYQRLLSTVSQWNSSLDLVPDDLHEEVHELIGANDFQYGNMKIVIHQKQDQQNEFVFLIFITEHQYPTSEEFENGVQVSLLDGIRENPNAKVMDVRLRAKANEIKQQQDVYETLLFDQNGCITEGSRSNVFFIKKQQLITPPLADVLPGVTRKHVIEICKSLNIILQEQKVSIEDLASMDAVFLSGTSRKVLPVKRIEGYSFSVENILMRQIQYAFDRKVEEYVRSHKR